MFKTCQSEIKDTVCTEPERRRRRTPQEKIAIVQEFFQPGSSVILVARRHNVDAY
ncbi:transposase [Sodalis sp. RH19]|uniref:transposase n=1 Tax=Sodalis sp. RH19 TaxID=3394334 RepID=UPI0039B5DC50